MSRGREWTATAFAATVVVASLFARVAVRGSYYPGWDIIPATEGTFVASTKPVREALALAFAPTPSVLSVPVHSLLCALLPGYLGRLWPWEYWAHVVTFALVLATFALIVKALALPGRRWWIVLLAWAASPPLLSFSLAGFGWGTAFLPHALALWAVLDRRLRRSWLVGPLACALAAHGLLAIVDALGARLPIGRRRCTVALVVGAIGLWSITGVFALSAALPRAL